MKCVYSKRYELPAGVKDAGVYIITDGNYMKAGKTGNAENRKGDYAKHGPNGRYEYFIPCSNEEEAAELEHELHFWLNARGLYGYNGREWVDCGGRMAARNMAEKLKDAAVMAGYEAIKVNKKNIELVNRG